MPQKLAFSKIHRRVGESLDSSYPCESVLEILDCGLELFPGLNEVWSCADLIELLCGPVFREHPFREAIPSPRFGRLESYQLQELLGHLLSDLFADDLDVYHGQRATLDTHWNLVQVELLEDPTLRQLCISVHET